MTRTIIIDLPPDLDAILVEKATGKDTPETLSATIVAEWCQPYAAAKEIEAQQALAQSPRFVALCVAAAASTPEKQDAALDAAEKALSAP